MRQVTCILRALKCDRYGATAQEYALIAAIIAGVVITSSTSLGNSVKSAYNTIGSALTAQANSV